MGSSTIRQIVPSARENEMNTESETLRNKALAHSEVCLLSDECKSDYKSDFEQAIFVVDATV